MVACFILLGTAIEGINLLHHIGPLSMLDSAAYAGAFSSEQLRAQAYLDVELQTIGFNISLVFFGVYCVLAGYLILRSTFLPRVLGVLLAIAGLCYLTNAFLTFLVPAFAADLLPYILVPSFIGEASLSLWLLVRGVDGARWLQQAQAHDRPLPAASAVPA